MESPVGQFEHIKQRGLPMWWLSLRSCIRCRQYWLVAQEERLNDIYVLARTTDRTAETILAMDEWPQALSTYEELLRVGAENGHAARYADPSELLPIAIDLVGQRRDITASELARLTNIGSHDALGLLQRAHDEIAAHGYPYPWRAA